MSTNTTHPGPETTSPDWSALAELLRLQEWDISQQLLANAILIFNQIRTDPSPSPASLHREAAHMLQLAFKLARQACGLDAKQTEVAPTGPPPLTPEEQAEVDAAYSNPPTVPAPTLSRTPAATAAAPQSKTENQNSNSSTPTAPPASQPSTLNPQPPSQPPPAPESKIEPQNSTIPSSPSEPNQSETGPVAPQPGEAGTTLNPQSSPRNTPAAESIIEPENPEIQPVLPESRGTLCVIRQPVAGVLQLYQQLSGLRLEIDPSIPKGALVTTQSRHSLTRTEALRILESALRYQAGVLLTPLEDGRVRVACAPRQPVPPPKK